MSKDDGAAELPKGKDKVREETSSVPDYWSFVKHARSRLDEEFVDVDAQANKVILALNRASSQVTYDLESSIHRPRGWSWSGYRLMFVLWLAGPLEPNRAARLTGMSRAAVSNLSKTLIAKGFVVKAAGVSDGRVVTLSLTDAGLHEIRTVFQEQNQRESSWVSALTDVEQELLVILLEKLMSNRDAVGAKDRK